MPDFVVMSFACQVYFLQCFWGFSDVVGTLLHFAFEGFQMEVGLGGDIFTRNFDKLGFLASEGTWFRHFWQYASHLGITVKVGEDYHLQPLRNGDITVMDFLLQRDVEKDTSYLATEFESSTNSPTCQRPLCVTVDQLIRGC